MKLGLAAVFAWLIALALKSRVAGKYVRAGPAGAGGHIVATAIVGLKAISRPGTDGGIARFSISGVA